MEKICFIWIRIEFFIALRAHYYNLYFLHYFYPFWYLSSDILIHFWACFVPGMLRNYRKKSERQQWSEEVMFKVIEVVRCLILWDTKKAPHTFHVPATTLFVAKWLKFLNFNQLTVESHVHQPVHH